MRTKAMRRIVFIGCVVLAFVGCKRRLKLEGKVTGFKPGTDTLMLHVASQKGASISCELPGYGCKRIDIGASGETDVELERQGGQTDNKVYLKGAFGPATNAVIVDPAASMPPSLKVAFNSSIECIGKDCSGSLETFPAGHIRVKAPPGTVVEVGNAKLTVGTDGNLDAPWSSTPAAKDQPLPKLIGQATTTYGSSNLAFTFPDKTKLSTKFDLTTEGAAPKLHAILKGVAKGPVPFPWEKGAPAPAKGKPVAVFCRALCYVGGAMDGTLADLRVVALPEEKGQRKTTCSYTNKSTGKPATANLTMHDEVATAYDRVTGKKLGTKAFQATSVCSWEVTAQSGSSLDNQNSYPDGAAVAQWAASFAR